MKIQKINQFTENIGKIPKLNMEETGQFIHQNVVSNLESSLSKDVFSHVMTHLDDVSQLGESKEMLSQVASHAEHSILSSAMLFRLIEPMNDLSKGNLSAALKRTAVNAVDVALYKIRMIYGGLGAIRGLIVKMRGAETPDAGFINGYFYAVRHWGKGRREVENALINPKKFLQDLKNDPIETQYAKYKEARENWLNKHRDILLQNSERNRSEIEAWGEAKIQMLKMSQDNLDRMIAMENLNQQTNQQEMQNYINSNNDLISKVHSLKFLQQNLLDNYNACMAEIKEMANATKDNKDKARIVQNISDLSENYYKEECDSINETIDFANKLINFNELLYKKSNQKGFRRIAGYDDIKQILKNKFIDPLKNTTDNKYMIPNLILFYGPKGCGKSLFSKVLADEAKCNVIDIELTMDSNQDFCNLQKSIQDAYNFYKSSGKHTIIRIEEIDGFIPNQSFKSKEIQNLINSLNQNYCTIVATTNYPNEINTNLFNTNVEKLYIAPPNKKNIQEVLKYYMEGFVDSNINYQELAEILQHKMNDKLISNAKLAECTISSLKEILIDNNEVIGQKYFENIFNNIEPDINK